MEVLQPSTFQAGQREHVLLQNPRRAGRKTGGVNIDIPEYQAWQCTHGQVGRMKSCRVDEIGPVADMSDSEQVSRYAAAVCKALLPSKIWGSQVNEQLVYRCQCATGQEYTCRPDVGVYSQSSTVSYELVVSRHFRSIRSFRDSGSTMLTGSEPATRTSGSRRRRMSRGRS
jgi:hypothetical protein